MFCDCTHKMAATLILNEIMLGAAGMEGNAMYIYLKLGNQRDTFSEYWVLIALKGLSNFCSCVLKNISLLSHRLDDNDELVRSSGF